MLRGLNHIFLFLALVAGVLLLLLLLIHPLLFMTAAGGVCLGFALGAIYFLQNTARAEAEVVSYEILGVDVEEMTPEEWEAMLEQFRNLPEEPPYYGSPHYTHQRERERLFSHKL